MTSMNFFIFPSKSLAFILLPISFPEFLVEYSFQLRRKSPTSFRFGVDTLDGKHIGNCTCYDINEKKGEAQVGIMIGDKDYWDKGYGVDAINTLVNHVYKTSSLNRLYLKTLDWNLRAQKSFKKCGFTPCQTLHKNGYSFLVMEITRPQWEARQDKA